MILTRTLVNELSAEKRQTVDAAIPEDDKQRIGWDDNDGDWRYVIESPSTMIGACILGIRDPAPTRPAAIRIWINTTHATNQVETDVLDEIVASLKRQGVTKLLEPTLIGFADSAAARDYLLESIPLL